MAKQRIRESKKAIFLIVGLIQLNLFLLASAWFPAIPIATFVSALMVILSVYLGAQGGIDLVSRYVGANGSFTQTQNRNERIEYVERKPRPRDFEDWEEGESEGKGTV